LLTGLRDTPLFEQILHSGRQLNSVEPRETLGAHSLAASNSWGLDTSSILSIH
jgi:hypothetical protein